jgi:AcrR family transcriptional regulator
MTPSLAGQHQPNKHQEKSEATRRKLFKAALRVFARDGFEAARIEDIAAEAGHTRGAFYAHFPSKEDLFFALLEHESHRNMERLRSLLEGCPNDNDEDRLKTLREYYVARASDRTWSILMLEFKLYAIRHPRMRAKLAAAYRSIREKMKWEGVGRIWPKSLACAPEDTDLRKVSLQLFLQGVVLERAYDPQTLSEAQASTLLRRLFDLVASEWASGRV